MANGTYDIITVGGGMGGSAFALAMADHGARVLVLEREQHFRDRVRGEGMHAWGVSEARALAIYERLCETCGVEVRWWDHIFDKIPFGISEVCGVWISVHPQSVLY
jgi:2-polyprenyl-6-methoxyphenol hydroxylase-like FAD-dependent oxidoreductase